MKNIRNFCIIAHIDHGKSTLADRFLEVTGTVEKRKMKEQLLDSMDLERERGITIKLQPATMIYKIPNNKFQIPNKFQNSNDKKKEENGSLENSSIQNSFKIQNLPAGRQGSKFEIPDENKLDPRFRRACLPVGRDDKKEGNKRNEYILNLIDTPGHVDFGYEVSRSLAAVEGAVLLVDATKGVQAQTLANLYQAVEQDLVIIPVINKIDLPNAEVEKTRQEIVKILGCAGDEIILASGKTGEGVEKILEAIVEKIPAPVSPLAEEILKAEQKISPSPSLQRGGTENETEKSLLQRGESDEGEAPLRALIFDSKYDSFKGVLAFVRIVDGRVKVGDEIFLMMAKEKSKVIEVGKFVPELSEKEFLSAGDIGYIATGFKSVEHCRVGDTITLAGNYKFSAQGGPASGWQIPNKFQNSNDKRKEGDESLENSDIQNSFKIQNLPAGRQGSKFEISDETKLDPRRREDDKGKELQNFLKSLPGYKEVRPMVYASFYPADGEDYNQMRSALEKLKLNDAALVFEGESSLALGKGFRLGFLGLLHLEIVQERLKREFGFQPTVTTPGVVYEIVKNTGEKKKIYSATEMPDPTEIKEIQEPRVKLSIITPTEYLGNILTLVSGTTRARYLATDYIDTDRASVEYNAPLLDIIINFHDALKSASSGFASMSYELCGYEAWDLVRMDIFVADEKIDAFSQIIPREKSESEGRKIVAKLKEVIPRQNFQIKLQAAIGGKMIARENIKAFRKDVTGYLYGGDFSRKKKLLEKQKKGKKRRGTHARAEIPPKAFLEVMKR